MHFSIKNMDNYQLFKDLPWGVLQQISRISINKHFYSKKSLIYSPIKMNSNIQILKHGLIKIYGLNNKGKSHTVYFVTKGHLFSQQGLFHNIPNYYYSAALENSWCYSINYKEFKNILNESLKLTQNVITNIDYIRIQLEDMNLSQNIDNSRELIYRYLVSKSKIFGNPFKLFIRNKEIANYLGIRPETFSRQLHELSLQNDIKIHKRMITII